jgi:hypothetical protein
MQQRDRGPRGSHGSRSSAVIGDGVHGSTGPRKGVAAVHTAASTGYSCTTTFGIFTASWQSAHRLWNITWGGRVSCTGPIGMNGDAKLYYGSELWATTGPFAGTTFMERIIPADYVPSGTWNTHFRTTKFAPTGQVWATAGPNCTGVGTQRLDCLHTGTQTLTPPA